MKDELCRLLKLVEAEPCVLPEEVENGCFDNAATNHTDFLRQIAQE